MLERGTQVAGYRIDGVVGEGGMAVVYRATQLSLDRVVALKVIAPELGDDPSFRTRFKREGQLQAALDHEHIVPVHEAGESEHGLFLAMRLIAGPTLKDLILSGQLDPRRSLRLLTQVAQALDTAHRAGLIHRDIKPQNILIDKDDHVFLADFGLTKALDDTTRLTGTGQFLGTIDYVAPEQIQGEPPVAASDCYSLTAVLYECLAGEVPFPGPNEAAVLHAHVVRPPPRISETHPELPEAMDEVIARGMAKNPAERPAAATALLRAATQALASAPAKPGARAQPTRQSPAGDGPASVQTTRVPGAQPAAAAPESAALEAPAAVTRQAGAPGEALPPAAPPADAPGAEAPARPGRSIASLVGLLGALAAIAIAVGFLVGHSGAKAGTARFTNSASVSHVQLRYPSDWHLSPGLSPVPGMTFSEPMTLGPNPAVGGITAGELGDAGGPTLLPAAFRRQVMGALPPADQVRLGEVEAFRYEGLQVRGLNGALTVYAAPTSAGVATLACWASPKAAPSVLAECERVAATLQLAGVTAYPLGPDHGYAARLSTAFTRLSSAVSAPLAQLSAATTPSAQASSAQRLAGAFSAAATELEGSSVPPMAGEAHAALLAALRQLSAAYSRAAAAARAGDGAAYRRAGAEVGAGSAALTDALRRFPALGYTVAS
ncbi:MAG TPA: serine/threonine-protein kinase [Solirubrobacteraceae bacterium]|nr:serine/threonine-protein kinase [Solirubrobacteraceae bacterium]